MYQVLSNSLLYFQRYALDKLNIVELRKGSNSVNTGDRVVVLAFCDSAHGPLSVYEVPFNYLQYFKKYAPDKIILAKIEKGNNSILVIELRFLQSALSLIVLYQCIKFHIIPLYTSRYMLRTSFFLQKLEGKQLH